MGIVGPGGPIPLGSNKSVEYLTLTFSNTDTEKTVNLTKGQNYLQCVPFVSARNDVTLVAFSELSISHTGVTAEIYNNSGTAALRLTRGTTSRSIVCHVFVVEFASAITVATGTLTGLATDGTVAISAVELPKTFLVFSATSSGAQEAPRDSFVRGRFNSTTQLGFNRNNDISTPNSTVNIRYYTVADPTGAFFSVQTAEASMGPGVTTVDTTISSIDMAKSMVISSADGASSTLGLNSEGYSYLQSATNVRSIRTNSTTNTDLHTTFVVSFVDSTTVQRGIRTTNTGTGGDANLSETVAITAVDTTRSMAKWTMCSRSIRSGRSTNASGNNRHSIELTSGGASITIRYRAAGSASENEAAWEVVTFNT